MSHASVLFFAAALFLNTEYLVHAAPTSSPSIPPTNTSVLVVPGKCEVFPPGECQTDVTVDECENDQQCQNIYTDYPGLKCCTNYCGIRVCDLPGNVKQQADEVVSYVCPVITEQLECPSKVMHECARNSECNQIYPGAGYICCKDSCGENYCETPILRVVKRRRY